MVEFEKPNFSYNYKVSSQIDALRNYRDNEPDRDIPDKKKHRLLIATWNIANLGAQERRDKDYQLIAEMISWFDIVAVQEVNDDLTGIRGIDKHLPQKYKLLFSDKAGNNERLTFVYDSNKIDLLEKVGEIAVPPKDHNYIKLNGVSREFTGFDRNPYLAAFKSGAFKFLLANVHIYFGDEGTEELKKASMERRSLETYAVGRWADLRRKSKYAYTKDIIALGDFNLPKVEKVDPIYKALTKRGLRLPEHSTSIGSSIRTDNQYDQIAFFPGQTKNEFTGKLGIFDFDGALFSTLWEEDKSVDENTKFFKYMRYYISDHRILWAEFKT